MPYSDGSPVCQPPAQLAPLRGRKQRASSRHSRGLVEFEACWSPANHPSAYLTCKPGRYSTGSFVRGGDMVVAGHGCWDKGCGQFSEKSG